MNIENVSLQDIYEFMERGDVKNAPRAIVAYLELLDKVRGMFLRIDKFGSKDAVIKHLMIADELSRYKAAIVCDEALEYFYSDSKVSKKAWRNIYADKMEKMINFAMLTVKDVSDAQKVIKMMVDTADIRGVNEPDKEDLPAELFQFPNIIYTFDAETAGLPKVDRNRLKELINKFPELTEKEKTHLQREAQVIPLKIFPDEHEDARK